MLGKLIKHEFHATARIMLPLFAITLGVSFLAHFAVRGLDSNIPQALRTLLIIVLVLYVIALIAVSLVAFIIMIRRFRTNVLGDEGYLTMTLPASVHSIIWSKIIVSVVWFAATVCVVGLAFVILLFRVEYVENILRYAWEIIQETEGIQYVQIATMLLELLLNALVYGIVVCLTFYSALSIGYGCARHKVLFSVIAYFAMNMIFSYLFSFGLIPLIPLLEEAFSSGDNAMLSWHVAMGVSMLIALIQGVIHYLVTVWNLRHRLNLE